MLHLAPISTRNQFGQLLNAKNLVGWAVEIGTHRGDFASVLLSSWRGIRLYCVDPWQDIPGYEWQAASLSGGGQDREKDYRIAEERLRVWQDRVQLVRDTSASAVERFRSETSLDFVYIDGDHSYKAVYADLSSWWPRIRPGGLLAGHDFICPGEVNGGWGQYVQRAVIRFAEENCRDVYLVNEEDGHPWSFYLEK